jgi:signal transduction histidine kinase
LLWSALKRQDYEARSLLDSGGRALSAYFSQANGSDLNPLFAGSSSRHNGALQAFLETGRQWIPLAIGLVIVVIVGILATRSVVQNERNDQRVKASLALIASADSVMLAVVEANAAQRGYMLTSDPEFLERYRSSRQELARDTRTLTQRLGASASDIAAERRLNDLLDARLEGYDQVDRLRVAGNRQASASLLVSSRFQTDAIRDELATIKNHEIAELSALQRAARSSAERVRALTIAGLASASLLALVSIVLLARRSAALEQANGEIRALADGLEERVAERTMALEAANEEIQRFAYIVSHDLRSPLVNIMGFTSELEEAQQIAASYVQALDIDGSHGVPEEVSRAIQSDMPEAMRFIRAATSRMDRLIKAILRISREGRRSLVNEVVDLNRLFDDLGASLVAQLESANATLQIGTLPSIESDWLALEQIFANLLDNAAKYLRHGVPGLITVSGERRDRQVVICVKDNGRGIAANDRDRIFELFRRAGTQDRPGDGIGLTHVQALLRRLGGRIEVESAPEEGSRFMVILPLNMAGKS